MEGAVVAQPLIRSLDTLLDITDQADWLVDTVLHTINQLAQDHVAPIAQDCTGGTYAVSSHSGMRMCVIKPCDEEPHAINNPKGRASRTSKAEPGIRPGILAGDGIYRERAAYLLDHHHFAGVPPTVLVSAKHPAFCLLDRSTTVPKQVPMQQKLTMGERLPLKKCSLQFYMPHVSHVEDIGPTFFPDEEVQKIAILDIRLCNTDRNPGNILLTPVFPRTIDEVTVDKAPVSTAEAAAADCVAPGSMIAPPPDAQQGLHPPPPTKLNAGDAAAIEFIELWRGVVHGRDPSAHPSDELPPSLRFAEDATDTSHSSPMDWSAGRAVFRADNPSTVSLKLPNPQLAPVAAPQESPQLTYHPAQLPEVSGAKPITQSSGATIHVPGQPQTTASAMSEWLMTPPHRPNPAAPRAIPPRSGSPKSRKSRSHAGGRGDRMAGIAPRHPASSTAMPGAQITTAATSPEVASPSDSPSSVSSAPGPDRHGLGSRFTPMVKGAVGPKPPPALDLDGPTAEPLFSSLFNDFQLPASSSPHAQFNGPASARTLSTMQPHQRSYDDAESASRNRSEVLSPPPLTLPNREGFGGDGSRGAGSPTSPDIPTNMSMSFDQLTAEKMREWTDQGAARSRAALSCSPTSDDFPVDHALVPDSDPGASGSDHPGSRKGYLTDAISSPQQQKSPGMLPPRPHDSCRTPTHTDGPSSRITRAVFDATRTPNRSPGAKSQLSTSATAMAKQSATPKGTSRHRQDSTSPARRQEVHRSASALTAKSLDLRRTLEPSTDGIGVPQSELTRAVSDSLQLPASKRPSSVPVHRIVSHNAKVTSRPDRMSPLWVCQAQAKDGCSPGAGRVPSLSDAGASIRGMHWESNPTNSLKRACMIMLTPIDHALCLPDVFSVDEDLPCWWNWQQARKPWTDRCLKYIATLNGRSDAILLHKQLRGAIRPKALLSLRSSTRLLQLGAAAGLSASQIVRLLCREESSHPAPLELAVRHALRSVSMGQSLPVANALSVATAPFDRMDVVGIAEKPSGSPIQVGRRVSPQAASVEATNLTKAMADAAVEAAEVDDDATSLSGLSEDSEVSAGELADSLEHLSAVTARLDGAARERSLSVEEWQSIMDEHDRILAKLDPLLLRIVARHAGKSVQTVHADACALLGAELAPPKLADCIVRGTAGGTPSSANRARSTSCA